MGQSKKIMEEMEGFNQETSPEIETETQNQLPAEIEQMAQAVSIQKRNEVQKVLNHVFQGVNTMREQLEKVVVKDENDKVSMKLANAIRLGVREVRLNADKVFDAKRAEVQHLMIEYKTEDSLWLKAKQVKDILTKEVELKAKWKEETATRFNIEQREIKTQKRELSVAAFNGEITRGEFEQMSDATFELFLSSLEKAYKEQQAEIKRIEAERQMEIKKREAEQARIEEERETERVRITEENKALKEKAQETQRLANIEQEKRNLQEKNRLQKEQEAEKQREAIAQKEREEANAKLQAEVKERERLQGLENNRLEDLKAALKLKEDQEQNELNKSDADKVKALVSELENIALNYDFTSSENQKMYNDVCLLIAKVIKHVNTLTEKQQTQ